MLKTHLSLFLLLLAAVFLGACQGQTDGLVPGAQVAEAALPAKENSAQPESPGTATQEFIPTPYPTRPLYEPGQLVEYTAQTGDTLLALAARFNTSVEEIMEANPFIPASATTMPSGMPMQIPIYYLPLWGSPYKILPDSQFVNGPSTVDFDIQEFVSKHPGWLNGYQYYAAGANRDGAGIVEYVALRYSVSPRLLLALLEYQAGALSNPQLTDDLETNTLGYNYWDHEGVYLQLNWAANLLNNGYYAYRAGRLSMIEHPDGRMERLDPWQNAATASLHYYFNQIYDEYNAYAWAISSEGLARTYAALFGDPWEDEQPHIPGSLTQPEFSLPFEPGNTWAFTGGPHSPWGVGEPFAALDFAPPDINAGSCQVSSQHTTAVADGVVVRSETGVVVLDLDGDGDERTGWNIFYLHLATRDRARVGAVLQDGDPVGYPSCEGGKSTGTHVHIARKYNGEWMLAEGRLAFNMEGWVAHDGAEHYQGTLTRAGETVTACVCSNAKSFITSEPR
jgi:murein DD-endopeptidase MepM/ murein hydrolase activator NlpD